MFYVVRPSLLSCSGENRLGKIISGGVLPCVLCGTCVLRALRNGLFSQLYMVISTKNCQTNTVYGSGDRNAAELAATQTGLVQAMKNNPA